MLLLLSLYVAFFGASEAQMKNPGNVAGFKNLGIGYCRYGYYAGWNKYDARSLAACAAKCKSEKMCQAFSLKPGHTCSRYSTASRLCASRTSAKDHWSYRKFVRIIPPYWGPSFYHGGCTACPANLHRKCPAGSAYRGGWSRKCGFWKMGCELKCEVAGGYHRQCCEHGRWCHKCGGKRTIGKCEGTGATYIRSTKGVCYYGFPLKDTDPEQIDNVLAEELVKQMDPADMPMLPGEAAADYMGRDAEEDWASIKARIRNWLGQISSWFKDVEEHKEGETYEDTTDYDDADPAGNAARGIVEEVESDGFSRFALPVVGVMSAGAIVAGGYQCMKGGAEEYEALM